MGTKGLAAAVSVVTGAVVNVTCGLLTQRWALGSEIATGVAVVVGGGLAWWLESAADRPKKSADPGAAAARLARLVRRQWQDEAKMRRLYQPVPLRVLWSSTGRPVAAGRPVVMDEPGTSWRELPLSGDADEIVALFRALPYRQLVVIGEPGSGKTVLAMLLTLGLLRNPVRDEPVPVLLPIAEWDPSTEEVRDFLVRRLGEEYSAVGRATLRRMLDRREITPILDGMDELPVERQSVAMEKLDAYASGENPKPLVLTCRSREYDRAVSTSGTPLGRGAVIEILPIEAGQIVEYLSEPQVGLERWREVFAELRENPGRSLAKALSTPLMVSLAKVAYRRPESTPAELLGFSGRAAITGHLIEGYVAAVYQPAEVSRLRHYDPAKAQRWLSTLAYHLYSAGTPDFWWWRLPLGAMAARPSRAGAIAGTGVVAALALLAGGLVTAVEGPWHGAAAAFTLAVVAVASCGGVFRPLWPGGYPPYRSFGFLTRHEQAVRLRWLGLAFGVGCGALTGLLLWDLWAGLAGTVAGGLFCTVLPRLPAARPRKATPRATLRANHANTVRAFLQYGLTGGLVFWTGATLFGGGPARAGVTAAVVYGCAAACDAGARTWISYRCARIYLAVMGLLPWRLWQFLADGHSRGTMRRAGTTWQFRHLLLQDRLRTEPYDRLLRRGAYLGLRRQSGVYAQRLIQRGEMAELFTLARRNDVVSGRLVAVLARRERLDDLWAMVENGDVNARSALSPLLAARQDVAGLRRLAELGSYGAVERVTRLLIDLGRKAELYDFIRQDESGEAASVAAEAFGRSGDEDGLRALIELGGEMAGRLLSDRLALREDLDGVRELVGLGFWSAEQDLAKLLAARGEVEELRALAEDGNFWAKNALVDLLFELGRTDELRVLARDRKSNAGSRLAELLAAQGRVEELRALAGRRRNREAMQRLVDLLVTRGDIDGLRSLARRNRVARARLVEYLAAEGLVDELRTYARRPNTQAYNLLVKLFADRGDLAELRALAVRRGDVVARRRLVTLLSEGDDADGLREMVELGDERARRALTEMLSERGDVAGLRALATAKYWFATLQLVRLLARRGELAEAVRIYEAYARRERRIPRYFADILLARGDTEEGLELLRLHADRGDVNAASALNGHLRRLQRWEELGDRAEAGNWSAASELLTLFEGQGRYEEALAVLRPYAEADSRAAQEWRVDLLIGNDQPEEALLILRGWAEDDMGSRLKMARILRDQGNTEEAWATVRADAETGEGTAVLELARWLAAEADLDGLRSLLLPIEKLRVDRWNTDELESLYRLMGESGMAEELGRQAADSELAARVYATRLEEQGRPEEALAVIERLSETSTSLLRRADLLAELGRPREALAALRESLAADTRASVAERVVRELVALGETAEALDTLRTAVGWRGLAKPWEYDWAATDLLSDLLKRERELPDLVERAAGGDFEAAYRLAETHLLQGREDAAAEVLAAHAGRFAGQH